MTRLAIGAAAPWFSAPSLVNPSFAFSAVGGRYVMLAFLPERGPAQEAAMAALEQARPLLRDRQVFTFLVARDAETAAAAQDRPYLQWLFDLEGEVGRMYGLEDADGRFTPGWLLIDPTIRILSWAPIGAPEPLLAVVSRLPPPEMHAGVPMHAPVLIVPRIFEPGLCRRLIQYYQEAGGQPSGTMQLIDGKTVGVMSSFKSRRDATIEDEDLVRQTLARLRIRLLPMIERAFSTRLSRVERFIVACYDAEENGHFNAHRDNTTPATAHRRFAVSINLNAEDFEGGDLRFAEYGPQTYRPPTGGAVVFGCSLLHEATPITRGKRYAFLPFLYDEVGAQQRQETAHTIVPCAHQDEGRRPGA